MEVLCRAGETQLQVGEKLNKLTLQVKGSVRSDVDRLVLVKGSVRSDVDRLVLVKGSVRSDVDRLVLVKGSVSSDVDRLVLAYCEGIST